MVAFFNAHLGEPSLTNLDRVRDGVQALDMLGGHRGHVSYAQDFSAPADERDGQRHPGVPHPERAGRVLGVHEQHPRARLDRIAMHEAASS